MKLNFSLALLAAVALAIAASPSEAASKKKKAAKASAPKVVVTKSQPVFVSHFNGCANASAQMWFPLAAVGSVGCGIVYAVPVFVESFLFPGSRA